MIRRVVLVGTLVILLVACADNDGTKDASTAADTSPSGQTLTVDEVDKRIAAAVAPLAKKLDDLNAAQKLTELRSSVQSGDKALGALDDRVAAMEIALAHSATTIAAVVDATTDNTNAIASLSQSIKFLQGSIGFITDDLQTASTGIGDLKQQNATQAAEIAKLTAAAAVTTGSPFNMNPVGDVLVDIYEASLWSRPDKKPLDCATLQAAVDAAFADGGSVDTIYAGKGVGYCKGKPNAKICLYKQHGADPTCLGGGDTGCNDYPKWFPRSGAATGTVYACPIKGVRPSAHMTWFQAALSCAAVGKNLLDNATWQLAVLGTPEATAKTVVGLCNMGSGKVRVTGGGQSCKSAFGMFDMVGNLDEWVADWMPGGQAWMGTQQLGMQSVWSSYGDGDFSMNVNSSAYSNETNSYVKGMLCTPFRGGFYSSGASGGPYAMNLRNGPTDWGQIHGHRCGKRLD